MDLLREFLVMILPWMPSATAIVIIAVAWNGYFIARNAAQLEARVTELERALEKEVAE